MPNRMYEAGRRFEYRVKNDLTRRGYRCKRTPGSKGPYDVHATRDGYSLYVQAKSGKDGVSHEGWNRLVDFCGSVAASLPVVADRDGRRIRYRLVTDHHRFGSRDWPSEIYEP